MRISAVGTCLALVAAMCSAGGAAGAAQARPAGATSLYAPSALVLGVTVAAAILPRLVR